MKIQSNTNPLSKLRRTSSTRFDPDFLAEIAVNLWRIKNALECETKDTEERESKRSWKHVQRLFSKLEKAGISVQERTGEPYHPGLALRLIASEEREGLDHATIIETLSPEIRLKENIIRAGEIIVGNPVASKT